MELRLKGRNHQRGYEKVELLHTSLRLERQEGRTQTVVSSEGIFFCSIHSSDEKKQGKQDSRFKSRSKICRENSLSTFPCCLLYSYGYFLLDYKYILDYIYILIKILYFYIYIIKREVQIQIHHKFTIYL